MWLTSLDIVAHLLGVIILQSTFSQEDRCRALHTRNNTQKCTIIHVTLDHILIVPLVNVGIIMNQLKWPTLQPLNDGATILTLCLVR